MYHQRGGRMADHADRRKILARIVTDVPVKRGPDGEGAGVTEQKGVAVGIALRRGLGTNGAAGAGTVVDDDALTKLLAHLVGDHTPDDRGAAARRKGNDECMVRFG